MSCQHENLEAGKCTNPKCDYCLHEVKFGGLCAVCGKIVEEENETAIDHIKMSHRDTGITVSFNEAKRLEQQDEKRLLQEKKLSLIVDLDQTILHATWEPYIADWVKERKKTDSITVKDISQFTLEGSPSIYSIKLRPGLSDFLVEMSKKYEMHIYTMGTRSYAEAVVKEIDPQGTLFQDRILSRDENGNMTKKRLERLFPSDTSKVVVLDDRADVWDYTPNLIQIKPYEYFIGIGDINSPFAQPKEDIIPSAGALHQPTTAKLTTTNVNKDIIGSENVNTPTKEEKMTEEKETKHDEDDIYSDAEDDDDSSISLPLPSQDSDLSDSSVESALSQKEPVTSDLKGSNTPNTGTQLPNTHDKDNILKVIKKVLFDVHNIYFNDLIKRNVKPDIAIILNSLKARVFRGVHVVFSGVIPLKQTRPEESWIWRMAASFGATCSHELTGKVTHLIAANPGTSKVLTARKHGNIKIVSPVWITDSVWHWQLQDETKYALPLVAEVSPTESEIENPESTNLEIEFDWDDDEVNEILGNESGDESEAAASQSAQQENGVAKNQVQGGNNLQSDDDEEEDMNSDELLLAENMEAIFDSDGYEEDDQEYGESNDEDEDDEDDDDEGEGEGGLSKRDKDDGDEDAEEPPLKKQK